METGPDYERSINHVYGNGTPGVFGQRVLPSLRSAQAARAVRSDGRQIVFRREIIKIGNPDFISSR